MACYREKWILLTEEDEGLSHYRNFDKPPAFLFLWSISPTCEESAVLSKVRYRQVFRVVPDSRDQQPETDRQSLL